MAKKKSDAVKLGLWVGEMVTLFKNADRKKLESALKARNLKKVCKALGMTEKELKEFHQKGFKLTQNLLRNSVKGAVAAFRSSIKL